jgi:predicted kinase
MSDQVGIPDPALVVLVGVSGSGKSTWARARYQPTEIVSSDDLRAMVGSGRHDLDASDDAFRVLDAIVAARLRRRLTAVVDTLGLDPDRRMSYHRLARAADLATVAVVVDVDARLAKQRP